MPENLPIIAGSRHLSVTEALASSTLEFVPLKGFDAYLAAARRLREQGRRNFVIQASEATFSLACEIQASISAERGDVSCTVAAGRASTRWQPPVANAAEFDAVFMLESCGNALSEALMDFVDAPVSIVAPITEHYFRRRAFFMISVPKSGTHMLFELLGAFNLTYGGPIQGTLSPQHFYFLSSENSHTSAPEFFRGLADKPRGGAEHPFFVTPTLFMYRNPLDVLVSEAFYLIDPRNTALAHYFSALEMEQRLLRLIGDDPLLGSLRHRMAMHRPWLRFPNVIPISFEELVGPKGGGSLAEQLKTIWSLQLKLHVPGSPAYYAAAVFRPETQTFRKGAINSHAEHLTEACYAALRELKQDFLHEFGYDLDDRFRPGWVPRFVDDFRRRRLVLKAPPTQVVERKASQGGKELSPGVVYAYRGYLLAAMGRVFCALPQSAARPVDPRLEAGGSRLHVAATCEALLSTLDTEPLADGVSPLQIVPHMHVKDLFQLDPLQPTLALADVCGFNIVGFNGRFYCLEQSRGSIDVQWDDTTEVFTAETLDEARAYCQSIRPDAKSVTPTGTIEST
jgi:hypothetical protein